VVRSSGYEPVLLGAQHEKRASIFACDEHVVFANEEVDFGPRDPWKTQENLKGVDVVRIKIPASALGDFMKPGTTTSSFLNTEVFIVAWDLIVADGRFWHHDWVVKADPDAVFFPQRLKARLETITSPDFLSNPPVYIVNCDRKFGIWNASPKLFGSLEVFSRTAVGAYAHEGVKKCKQMDFSGWGEDYYMELCMDLLGVKAHSDFDMLGDERCHPASCFDQEKVVFHPFKDAASYFTCWYQSLGPEGARDWLKQVDAERLSRREEEQGEEMRAEAAAWHSAARTASGDRSSRTSVLRRVQD